MSLRRWTPAAWALGLVLGGAAWAEDPAQISAQVEVVERLGEPLPLELELTDSDGRRVRLGDLLGGERPVVLSLVYYRCETLCGLMLSGLANALRQTGLTPGEDYAAISVSIDPSEGPALAAERQRGYLQALGAPERPAAWGFLTGEEAAIRTLADAVGFRFAYDGDLRQFAHAAVVMVLTPEGKLSRYVYGVRYPPRDLKLALIEAAGGRVGTAFERFLLTCYRYEPASRRYELYIRGVIQGGGMLVFFAVAGLLAVLWRRELKHRAPQDPSSPSGGG